MQGLPFHGRTLCSHTDLLHFVLMPHARIVGTIHRWHLQMSSLGPVSPVNRPLGHTIRRLIPPGTIWLVFESPVLGLAKDCKQTGLRPNKTKTKKDHLLVFCSLGLGLFISEKSKRPKKTSLNWSFLGPIMYISTTILGLFLVILSYFFGIYLCRFSLTREYSTCHPEMWISTPFLGQITWSNALNVAKGRYYNPSCHP